MLTKIFLDHGVDNMQIKLDHFFSRTRYIIKFAKFPIVWVSKMQIEIVLSTNEAEYTSLSQSMRDLILLIHIMLEVSSVFGMKYDL